MRVNKSIIIVILIAILQAVFFILKAFNVINWSWVWVVSPLWIPYFLFIIVGLLIALYLILYDIKERIFKKHGRGISGNQKS